MIEIHKRLVARLENEIKACEELPTWDELPEKNENSVWRWSEEEIQEARKWINYPINRVRFLRARYSVTNV